MTTDDINIEEETAASGGIVTCAADFHDEIGELAEFFERPSLANAARFALSIGIQKNIRFKKEKWKKPTKNKKIRTIAHLGGTFSDNGKYDFGVLAEMLDLYEPDDTKIPLNAFLSEYISGGMQWIKEQEIHKGANFSALKSDEQFTSLFEN